MLMIQIGRIVDRKLDVQNYWVDVDLSASEIFAEITGRDTYFRIPNSENLDNWHDIVQEEWSAQDDDIYYCYECPYVETTDWYGYSDGYLYKLNNLIQRMSSSLTLAKDFSSKVAYM